VRTEVKRDEHIVAAPCGVPRKPKPARYAVIGQAMPVAQGD
jgi:hypothetical protein